MISTGHEVPPLRSRHREGDYVPLQAGQGVAKDVGSCADPFACYGFADFVRILKCVEELRAEFPCAVGGTPGASASSPPVEGEPVHQQEGTNAATLQSPLWDPEPDD